MPGPVSDSYDPEFGTSYNAYLVRKAIQNESQKITGILGPDLKEILSVVDGAEGKHHNLLITERSLRIIRFALNYAADVI